MAYIIDGHNLIPKVPGLSLRSADDEMQLVEQLQEFCRRRRKKADVFFDGAPAGHAGTRKMGLLNVHFVRQGMSADRAIEIHLQKLKRAARNWTVVSSDHAVQTAARSMHAGVQSSEDFARLLSETLRAAPKTSEPDDQPVIPKDEINEWLAPFGEHPEEE